MAYKWIVNGLIFISCLLVGLAASRLQTTSTAKPNPTVLNIMSPASIESVPHIKFPAGVQKFNAPEFTVDFYAQFKSDGSVGDVNADSTVFYKTAVPTESRYPVFPAQPSREDAIKVKNEVVELVASQIRNVKFKPRIWGGQPVDENVWIRVKLIIADAHAPRISSLPSCNEIELTFHADGGEIWKSKVDGETHCYSF